MINHEKAGENIRNPEKWIKLNIHKERLENELSKE